MLSFGTYIVQHHIVFVRRRSNRVLLVVLVEIRRYFVSSFRERKFNSMANARFYLFSYDELRLKHTSNLPVNSPRLLNSCLMGKTSRTLLYCARQMGFLQRRWAEIEINFQMAHRPCNIVQTTPNDKKSALFDNFSLKLLAMWLQIHMCFTWSVHAYSRIRILKKRYLMAFISLLLCFLLQPFPGGIGTC